ncbi:hypothetical protein TKK_0001052 [Trichogramma kaykai]|uniref:UDENN domain-containing protein n=1 Tax=Trichogramma kaykai TaxID=54128 RepID=A0ABD2WT74_9HYME
MQFIMRCYESMISCSIIEKDCNNDTLWTWNYPSIANLDRVIITRKYNFQLEHNYFQTFIFSRHNSKWFYIYNSDTSESDILVKVKQFAIVLIAQDYFPHKYQSLGKILSRAYIKSGSPIDILKLYLMTFSKNSCIINDNHIFSSQDFDDLPFGTTTNIRELIKTFELEIILIYTALLLKKRIVVYHHSLEELLKWIKSFPALMKHRKLTDYLFSWVDFVPDELFELKKHSFYIAGFKDSIISSRTDLYDLLVNIPAREIIIANHAKESLNMTKTHKEIAMFMLQLGENQSFSEAQIISEINDKTQDLLKQLTSLATVKTCEGDMKVPIQAIKGKNLSTAVENFLVNLAVAENLLIM